VFTTKHYSFFWESFLIKTHKYIFEALRDLIDAIHLFYQNQFPYWSFEKLILHFDFENNLMCIQKLYFWHSTCRMTSESSNSFIKVTKLWKEKKKKWINTLTPWLLNNVFLNVWVMVCSELVAHNSWNASLQRLNHHTGWGQSLLIIVACAWNEERPSLLFLSRSKISTSLAIPFWAWIIFLSWKNPD